MKLNLEDLMPAAAELKISGCDSILKLKPFSLKYQIWARRTWGAEKLKEIFADQNIEEISRLAYEILEPESKETVGTFEEFTDKILGAKDVMALMQAMLVTIGLSQPEIKKIADGQNPFEAPTKEPKSKPIGAKSTT